MEKINLTKAKEILKEQGYEIEVKLEEAFNEFFYVAEDAKLRFTEEHEISDKVNITSMSNFISMHKKELENYCLKDFDNNDMITDLYSEIVKRGVNHLLNEELAKFKINTLSDDITVKEDAEYAVKSRNCKRCWYVLHYDVKTTEYLNEIVFLSLAEAIALYSGSTPLNENDRVELMFAPEDDDEEFSDNIVVAWKDGKNLIASKKDNDASSHTIQTVAESLVKEEKMKTIVLKNVSPRKLCTFYGGWTDNITFCGIIEVNQDKSYFFEYHEDENKVIYFNWKDAETKEIPLGELRINLKNEEGNLDELVIAFAKLCDLEYDEIKNIYIENFNTTSNFFDVLQIAEAHSKEKLKEYFFKEIVSSFNLEEFIQLLK